MLLSTDLPLAEVHDLAVLDLDGVVYAGRDAIPGAAAALRDARAAGMELAFVTNNASRTPQAVADHLTELGFEARAEDVVTSSQAAARLLAAALEPGAIVYTLGGSGLTAAVEEVGLVPTVDPEADVSAVVQGYGGKVRWRQVVDGAILVKAGVTWVATNMDMTFPTGKGIGPGTGTLVDLVGRFAERTPAVAGKPETALFEETRDRLGGKAPVVVGDRIDTDIEGAVRMGWPALLVMTGVTDLAGLVAVPAGMRPSYIGANLSALTAPQQAPTREGEAWSAGGWQARVTDGALEVAGSGDASAWWRTCACAAWEYLDAEGGPADITSVVPPR